MRIHWTGAVTPRAPLSSRQNERVRLNSYLIKSTIVAAIGGLLPGFDTAVIAGTTRDLTRIYGLSPASLGLTVSSALWGTSWVQCSRGCQATGTAGVTICGACEHLRYDELLKNKSASGGRPQMRFAGGSGTASKKCL